LHAFIKAKKKEKYASNEKKKWHDFETWLSRSSRSTVCLLIRL